MNLTDYLTQPILLPEINIILLIALILFGITLTYNGYIDQKKRHTPAQQKILGTPNHHPACIHIIRRI